MLLVQALVRAGRKEEAIVIAESLDNLIKSNKIGYEMFKQQFDSVILGKLTDGAKNLGGPAWRDQREDLEEERIVSLNEECFMAGGMDMYDC